MTRGRIFLRYALPLVLWLLVMALLSTEQLGASFTYRVLSVVVQFFYAEVSVETLRWLHAGLRKSAHVVEYFIFAWLLWRALRREAAERWRASWAGLTLLVGAGTAVLDERHQAHTRGRTGSVLDVGWDALGLLLALTWFYWRQQQESARGAPAAESR